MCTVCLCICNVYVYVHMCDVSMYMIMCVCVVCTCVCMVCVCDYECVRFYDSDEKQEKALTAEFNPWNPCKKLGKQN